jgi:hypothetical protein
VRHQAPKRLNDERDATLDLVNGVRMDWVERRRDPQLRQGFLSGPPGVLQELPEFRDRASAAGLRYV